MSPALLSEFDHVGRRVLGARAASAAIDRLARWVREGRLLLPEVTSETIETAQRVRAAYPDLELDLADASTVAVAASFDTEAILTTDRRDFRVIRPLSRHEAFRLLPDDL